MIGHVVMGKKALNDLGTFAKSTIKNGEPDFKAVAAKARK